MMRRFCCYIERSSTSANRSTPYAMLGNDPGFRPSRFGEVSSFCLCCATEASTEWNKRVDSPNE
jgi:hypothetical protein